MVYFLFAFGFVLLLYGADLLVQNASALARRFHLPDIVIGLTIVSIGTSAPELIISLTATIQGETDLAIGNILGSNIFNVFVIIGLTALIQPIRVLPSTTWKEVPFSLLAAVLLAVCSLDYLIEGRGQNALGRIDGLVFLSFFIIFLIYSFQLSRTNSGTGRVELPESKGKPLYLTLALLIAGVAMLYLGGRWIVGGADSVGRLLGLSENVIGLVIVAVATSLPELITSIIAARRGSPDMAIGNAIGSNIFNIFLILGASALFRPLPFGEAQMADAGMTLFSHLVLFAVILLGRKAHTISRIEGVLMLLIYVAYMSWAVVVR